MTVGGVGTHNLLSCPVGEALGPVHPRRQHCVTANHSLRDTLRKTFVLVWLGGLMEERLITSVLGGPFPASSSVSEEKASCTFLKASVPPSSFLTGGN